MVSAIQSVEVFASAARTSTANSGDQNSRGCKGVSLTLDVTVASGTTPTLDVKLQRKDPVSGVYTDIPGAAFAQKTGVSNDKLDLYPGIAVVANESVNNVLSEQWRAVATIGGTTPSFTFTLAGSYIP